MISDPGGRFRGYIGCALGLTIAKHLQAGYLSDEQSITSRRLSLLTLKLLSLDPSLSLSLSLYETMTLKLTTIPMATSKAAQPPEPKETPNIQTTIQTFAADLADIQSFLSISFSLTRAAKVKKFLTSALASLPKTFDFDILRQDDQVDYLLLQSHIERLLHQGSAAEKKYQQAKDLGLFGEWVDVCIQFVETRHYVGRQSGREIATAFQAAEKGIDGLIRLIDSERSFGGDKERFIVFWTIARFEELHEVLTEAVGFYQGYDPVITWWIDKPWQSLSTKLTELIAALRKKTGVDGSSSADDVVGDPIGREALLEELEAEWIAYTPEELVQIGEEEFRWCEREMEKASKALGFSSSQDALEHVKNTFVEPGEQIHVSAGNGTHDIFELQLISNCRLSAISPTRQSHTWKSTIS